MIGTDSIFTYVHRNVCIYRVCVDKVTTMFRPQYNPKTLEEFLYLNLVTDRHNLLEEYLRGHSYKPCMDIYVDIVMGIVDFENVEAANKLLENEDRKSVV